MNARFSFRIATLAVCLLCGVLTAMPLSAQTAEQRRQISEWIKSYEPLYPGLERFSLKKLTINDKTRQISVACNDNFGDIPFRPALIKTMSDEVRTALGTAYKDYKVLIFTRDKNVDEFVPNYYRTKGTVDASRLSRRNTTRRLVENTSLPYDITEGLKNRNIALWPSHGWHYEQRLDRWEWQRARLLETVEDKLSLSFVLPYLLPMLENAGASVLLPRERSLQTKEVIVDNDTHKDGIYLEQGVKSYFATTPNAGFAHKREVYTDGQNPFDEGSARSMKSDDDPSATITWEPNIPEAGYYPVYVAYQSVDNGVDDAAYTVYHTGGATNFKVNQTKGGGTWIYLGDFYFLKGLNRETGRVTLTNKSRHGGRLVTADAVRFGGGMGNIARRPADEQTVAQIVADDPKAKPKLISIFPKTDYTTSGRARYLEGARYAMQWAGIPFSVYSYTKGLNDYTDDFASRATWVNYLNNGSSNQPDSVGLGIPIDLALAFHTDAGSKTDSVVGTLTIYASEKKNDSKKDFDKYSNGQSRMAARDMADMISTSITDDIRRTYAPEWTRRGMWDKSYAETRIAEVPSVILELLSHQNFTDMQYAHDPRFKFVVGRAVYKAVARYVAFQNRKDCSIQPLPVHGFATRLVGDSIRLSWHPTLDSLEPTAQPKAFVVYQRRDNLGFDNGLLVTDSVLTLPFEPGVLKSYRITAVNEGGESFPSEILAAYRDPRPKGEVLIVNGFERISGPESLAAGNYAGFPSWGDQGVPYLYDISYVGAQHVFDRSKAWVDDDAPGFGASNSDEESIVVAGNSFDYPYRHGVALADLGYSFCSTSSAAMTMDSVDLSRYQAIDYILGKQRECGIGANSTFREFKTFSPAMQQRLTAYCQSGKALLVTGAYIGTDLWSRNSTRADRAFAENTLKFTFRTDNASQTGRVSAVYAPQMNFAGSYQFAHKRNEQIYAVEAPDGIEPIGGSQTIMRYDGNNISAATAYAGSYRTLVCGFPLETLTTAAQREAFMKQALAFLLQENTAGKDAVR